MLAGGCSSLAWRLWVGFTLYGRTVGVLLLHSHVRQPVQAARVKVCFRGTIVLGQGQQQPCVQLPDEPFSNVPKSPTCVLLQSGCLGSCTDQGKRNIYNRVELSTALQHPSGRLPKVTLVSPYGTCLTRHSCGKGPVHSYMRFCCPECLTQGVHPCPTGGSSGALKSPGGTASWRRPSRPLQAPRWAPPS